MIVDISLLLKLARDGAAAVATRKQIAEREIMSDLAPLHWCSLPADERGSGFHPIPGIGTAVRYRFGSGPDPVGKSSIYESEPGRIHYFCLNWRNHEKQEG